MVDLLITLETISWAPIYVTNDVNIQLDFFNAVLLELYNSFVPVKVVTPKYSKEWMNREIEHLIRERDFAHYLWKRFKTEVLLNNFKSLRNQVTKAIRDAKTRVYSRKLNLSLPKCQLWRNIKCMGLKGNSPSCSIDPDVLNEFFVQNNHNTRRDEDIPNTFTPLDDNSGAFSFRQVTCDEVMAAFASIKSKSMGLDGLDVRWLKLLLPFIVSHLTHIINTSIMTSTFPCQWKYAKVIPVNKKPNPQDKADFRSISILPVCSKIEEKLLYSQMNSYIHSNHLLFEFQSAFRPKHSTASSIIYLVDKIRKNIDNRLVSLLVFLDFSKAFDSIDFKIMCRKLKLLYNFDNTSIKLIYSYLVGRFQKVVVGASSSAFLGLDSGVPQGSILGPLLFCLYINDLKDVPRHTQLQMYADDVQLTCSSKFNSIEDNIGKMNEDLERIVEWSCENNLKLNPTKSQAIFISIRSFDVSCFSPILLDDTCVEYVDRVKYLGVVFNRTLTWDEHIKCIVAKIYGSLRRLWHFANYTPHSVREHLVRTLLLPAITYCCTAFPILDARNGSKLNVAFIACAMYINNLNRFAHISIHARGILNCTLYNYMKFLAAVMVYKLIYNIGPGYLCSELRKCRSSRNNQLIIPRFNALQSERTFFICGPRIWNSLPAKIRLSTTVGVFRKLAFEHFSALV